jgi:DNA-binding transcriptional regulator YdaS (Cro superfamily)
MKLQTYLVEKRGRTQELAKALTVTGSLVTQWASGKPVAAERCPQIEQATGGAVRRWDLRPDDWHRIWPELVGTDGAPAVEVRDAA